MHQADLEVHTLLLLESSSPFERADATPDVFQAEIVAKSSTLIAVFQLTTTGVGLLN